MSANCWSFKDNEMFNTKTALDLQGYRLVFVVDKRGTEYAELQPFFDVVPVCSKQIVLA